jgi:hypothetical protein
MGPSSALCFEIQVYSLFLAADKDYVEIGQRCPCLGQPFPCLVGWFDYVHYNLSLMFVFAI